MTIEEQNIELVRKAIREKIDQQVNDPTAINGYARATGHLQGMLEMLVRDVPEARSYVAEYLM